MDHRKLSLNEQCRGRIVIVGVAKHTLSLIRALQIIGRVDEIVLIEEDWSKASAFKDMESVTVINEEVEDALMPPVDSFDYAFVCVNYGGDVRDFIDSVEPVICSLVNRGWVPTSSCVDVFGIGEASRQLHSRIYEEFDKCRHDPEYLKHLVSAKHKNPVKEKIQPFFKFLWKNAECVGHEIIFEEAADVEDWGTAFCQLIFFPGGYERFEEFAAIGGLINE